MPPMPEASIKVHFGIAVRALRSKAQLTQDVLGQRARLHRTYITDIERGSRNVSLVAIERLAKALGISVVNLMTAADKAKSGKMSAPPSRRSKAR